MSRAVLRYRGVFAVLATTMLTATSAWAQDDAQQCVVSLDSSRGSSSLAWERATDDARRDIAGKATDCARIDVAPEDQSAKVTFTTRDGRVATRNLASPSELRAVVRALIVTVMDNAPTATTDVQTTKEVDEPKNEPETSDPETNRDPSDGERSSTESFRLEHTTVDRLEPPRAEQHREPRLLLSGSGGVMSSGVDDNAAPAFAGGLAVRLGHYELGILARAEAEHRVDFADTTQRAELAMWGGGLTAGRRDPLFKSSVSLVYGLSMSGCGVEEARRTANANRTTTTTSSTGRSRGGDEQTAWTFEPRAGAYLGVVLPAASITRSIDVRVRTQLVGETNLSTFASTRVDEGQQITPRRFSVAWMIGVETGLLP